MFGVKRERGVERFPVQLAWRLVMQQVQKVPCHTVIAGFDIDAFTVAVVAVPIKQHRGQARKQAICNLCLVGKIALSLHVAEDRNTAAQYVHRVSVCRNNLKHLFYRVRQPA